MHLMNKDKEYIEIPVLNGFMFDECIGTLRVLKGSLPIEPNFHLAIGYIEDPFKLVCVSPVADALFKGSIE